MLKVSDFDHIPVLLYQTVDALNVRPGGIYVDCTAGGGSHSAEIARRMKGQGILISIDKDDAALAACMERREAFAGIDWMPVKSDYKDIDDIIETPGNNGGTVGGSSNTTGSDNSYSGSSDVSNTGADGQEDTIFFALAGIMLAASGVMFVTRRKRED